MQAVTFSSVGADAKTTMEPIPHPGPGQVLVKTLYSAMNPIDAFSATTGLLVVAWPFTVGADGTGTITAVGPTVPPEFAIGTTVFGCTRLGTPGHGTCAEYYLMDTQVTFRLTPKMAAASLTPLGASTLGAAVLTACLGLFQGLHIPLSALTSPPSEEEPKDSILILGGASSVGKAAIQLAVAAGYEVLTSCSPASGPVVSKLGAEWFSYKDPLESQLETISRKAKNVTLIFDAVAENEPMLAERVFSSSASSSESPKYFTTTNDWARIGNFGGGKTHGIALGLVGRSEGAELNEKVAAYIVASSKLMEEGKLAAGEVELVGEGVEAGVEAYKYQVSGKAGRKKVVVRVSGEGGD